MSHKKQLVAVALAAVGLSFSASSARADLLGEEFGLTASLDVASAYVHEGVTRSKGMVLQPAVALSYTDLVRFDLWANYDLESYQRRNVNSWEFSEIDMGLTFSVPGLPEPFGLDVAYWESRYPNGGPTLTDREVGVIGSVDLPVKPSLGVWYGLSGNDGVDNRYLLEGKLGHVVALCPHVDLELDGAVRYKASQSRGAENGWSDYLLTAALKWDIFRASLSWVGRLDNNVLPRGDYRVKWVAMAGVSKAF